MRIRTMVASTGILALLFTNARSQVSLCGGGDFTNPSSVQTCWKKGAVPELVEFTMSHDPDVGNKAPGSLRATVTRPKGSLPCRTEQMMTGNMNVGETMTLSGYVKGKRPWPRRAKVNAFEIEVIAMNASSQGTGFWTDTFVVDTDWKHFAVDFKRPSAESIIFWACFDMMDTGTLWFDDLEVTYKSPSAVLPVTPAATGKTTPWPLNTAQWLDIRGRRFESTGECREAGCYLVPPPEKAGRKNRRLLLVR